MSSEDEDDSEGGSVVDSEDADEEGSEEEDMEDEEEGLSWDELEKEAARWVGLADSMSACGHGSQMAWPEGGHTTKMSAANWVKG